MNLRGDRNCCAGCGQHFNSTFAFDKHRAGEHANNGRYCLTIDQMQAKGMVLGADGFWRGEAMPACYFVERGEADGKAMKETNA